MTKMSPMKLMVVGVLVLAAGLGGVPQASAGTITSVSFSGPGAGNVDGTVSTPSPNNDNTTSASPNEVDLAKTFGSVGLIDIQFTVLNSGAAAPGTTEYFFSETVTNNTGVAWLDFHMVLGFGIGANFVMSGLGDNLDFDTCGTLGCSQLDPTPTSGVFTSLAHGANELSWSGGSVPNGGSVTFTFSLDVPDAASCSQTTPACPVIDGGYLITLRQFPTTENGETPVPLPGTLILLGSGIVALGAAGWKRGRARA
jgi:hypothetical protein